MAEVQVTVSTRKSVQECASAFRGAVEGSYGGARKFLRGVSAIRGGPESGGIDFLTCLVVVIGVQAP